MNQITYFSPVWWWAVSCLGISARNVSQLSVDHQGEVPGREMTAVLLLALLHMFWLEIILQGSLLTPELTPELTPSVLKKYHQLQYKVGPTQPLKTEGQLSEIIISLSLTFLSSFSRIFSYFLDIQARLERWESESSESKDIELVEEIASAVQGCSSLGARHWPSQQDRN